LKDVIKYFFLKTKWFLLPYSFFAAISLVYLLMNEKGSEVLSINSISNTWLDRFFLIVTDFGLGSFIAIVAALILFYNIRWSFLMFLSLGWVGVLTFVFKRIMFTGETRPLHYFYYADFPRFLHDVPLIYYNSFPSGHTMAFFAFSMIIAFLSDKKIVQIISFVGASLVGLSRIYLLQHFGNDVLAGSLLGIIAALLSVIIVDAVLNFKNSRLSRIGLWGLLFKRRN